MIIVDDAFSIHNTTRNQGVMFFFMGICDACTPHNHRDDTSMMEIVAKLGPTSW
jgi:hypothetical protein